MTNRFTIVSSCALAAIFAGLLGGLGACTPPPPPAKPQIPTRPLDLQMPLEAPDEATMSRLPAAWEAEAAASSTKLETGPLQGPGNFNELDGNLTSAYARSPYLVADGGDNDRKLTTRLPADSARPFMEAANKSFGDGKLDEALLDYRKVIERDPLYAKAYFYVAEIESQRRDLDAATSWNDRGLRLSARDAYGHALRAEILASQGRTEVARASLAYALALDPFAPRAVKLLQRLGGRAPGIEPPIFVQLKQARRARRRCWSRAAAAIRPGSATRFAARCWRTTGGFAASSSSPRRRRARRARCRWKKRPHVGTWPPPRIAPSTARGRRTRISNAGRAPTTRIFCEKR